MSCIVSTQWYVLCSTWMNAVFDLLRRRVLQVQYRTSKLNIAPLRAVFLRVQHSGRGSVEVHKASGEKCGLGNAHLGQRLPPYDDPPAPQKPSPITTRPSRPRPTNLARASPTIARIAQSKQSSTPPRCIDYTQIPPVHGLSFEASRSTTSLVPPPWVFPRTPMQRMDSVHSEWSCVTFRKKADI